MKLYTEEQLISAMMSGIISQIGQPIELEVVYSVLMESTTPIELPSDEEIREERLLQFPDSEYTNRANDRLAFYCGAKFVINKIQGGNK